MKTRTLRILAISLVISGTVGCSQETESVTATPAVTTGSSTIMENTNKSVQMEPEEMKDSSSDPDMSLVEDAQSVIKEVKEALANNDFELARILLEKLAGMKSMLPESTQDQIDALQELLAAHKTAAGNAPIMDSLKDKMPGIGN